MMYHERYTFWLGGEAPAVWQDYQTEQRKHIEQAQRDADALRHLPELIDE